MRQKAGSSGTIDAVRKDRLARFRWCPELAFFADRRERRAVLKRFWRERVGLGRLLLITVALGLGGGIVQVLYTTTTERLLTAWGVADRGWVGGCFAGLAGATIGLAIQYLFRKPLRKYLREQLNAKGVPICIACGYDLRGQVDPRCPECGTAFDPKLIKRPSDPAAGPPD